MTRTRTTAAAAVAIAAVAAGAQTAPAMAKTYPVKANVDGRGSLKKDPVADENYLLAREQVEIACQARGRPAYGSRLWDLVAKGGKRLFVPDKFIQTGTDGPAPGVRTCGPSDIPSSGEPTRILFVHGHGDHRAGKDCNGEYWKDALSYYQSAAGRPRSSLSTIGYYRGDSGKCDAMVGAGDADDKTKIQDIARDLARYIDDSYTSRGRPVNIVAHSMGGLVTRVALLGSAQHWKGFPQHKLNVNNVATLGTPHNGVADAGAGKTEQWRQMSRGSSFLKRLRQRGSGLGDPWAAGTDWTLIGSRGDRTVPYDSTIDRGRHADQKFGYQSGRIGHGGIRTLHGGRRYRLTYAHASGNHGPHETRRGWSPLKAAFKAATRKGDGLPR